MRKCRRIHLTWSRTSMTGVPAALLPGMTRAACALLIARCKPSRLSDLCVCRAEDQQLLLTMPVGLLPCLEVHITAACDVAEPATTHDLIMEEVHSPSHMAWVQCMLEQYPTLSLWH